MRIPANIISKNKYTVGKEFIYLDDHQSYQGFYYEINNKFFAGADFSTSARELIKATSAKVNKLLLNPKTENYAKVSNFQLPISVPPPPRSNFYENIPDALEEYDAFFYKRMVGKDILIKQIDEQTYSAYQNNPFYQVIKVKINDSDTGITNEELTRADREMPGFAQWFLSDKSG